MPGEREYRTEKVTKYSSCSKSFELFMASVPFDPPVGRLREGECLLAWLPKELNTCYGQWLFAPMCAWLFEYWATLDVLKHLRLLRRVAPSQLISGMAGGQLPQGRNVTNLQLISIGVNAYSSVLWELGLVLQGTPLYPWHIFIQIFVASNDSSIVSPFLCISRH